MTSASLSVVVVSSSGSPELGRNAARAVKSAARGLPAQLIVVAPIADAGLVSAVERSGGEFVKAPSGSSRAEMCDLGMRVANGSIVAVRDDIAVGNAEWMDAYRTLIPARELPRVPAESVLMDTLVPSRAVLADVAAPRVESKVGSRSASGEVAAAI